LHSPFDSFFQQNLHGLACFFADRFLHLGLHRQLMPAVAQSHEGTSKDVAINLASYFHQTACRRISPTAAKRHKSSRRHWDSFAVWP
jgi:hypothetical protein